MTEENVEGTEQNQGPVIRVARVSEGMKEVPFVPGMTVSEAIEAAGYSIGGEDQVRVNNQPAGDLDMTVPADATVLIVQTISGN